MVSRRRVLALVPALLILGGTSMSDPADAQDKPRERTITITASGEVAAEPDLAVISTGVVSEAETARAALMTNSTAMRKVIDGLKTAGIAARDIRTSQLSIEPRYTSSTSGRASSIQGFRVTNRVTVTLRDMTKLGETLDQVSSLGANQMGGIQFMVSKAETLTDEARGQAMQNAIRRAQLYAKAAGADLGPVVTITEEVHAFRPYAGGVARTASAAPAIPIEQGEQKLTVNVNVTWALK